MASPLEIEEVSFDYGGPDVFQNFSMTIAEQGQCLLLGPSGSGKSTLVNLVCGFLKPRSGFIRIAGELISSGSEPQRDAVRRRHLAIIFQSLRLVSALSVLGNLQLAARLAGRSVSRAEVSALLEELDIVDKASAKPHQLSQGQAQRAAIARALIVKPDLLLADEPTSALDDANAERVANLFRQMTKDHGTSLLVATHDARLRTHFSTVLDLNGGER